MIIDKISENILLSLQQTFHLQPKSSEIEVTQTSSREHGDYTSNIAFKLAKDLKKSPLSIAEELAVSLQENGGFKKVEAVNGFLNFFLDHEYFQGVLAEVLDNKEHYADLDIYKGKKIQVEFISANPTGPLTLANGRGGFGGDVLSKVFTKCGATVEREYYVNDGGNQVKLLGNSILAALGKCENSDDLYKGPYIEEWANANSDAIDLEVADGFVLGSIAAKDLLGNKIKPSVEKMGIHFDNWFSEKEMIDRGEVDESIEKIKALGLTKEEDGALWFKTTDFGDDKDRVLIKADGEKTYFANDVAYHWDKFSKRHFDKVVNFWGADHHGYVGRMLAAVTAMGFGGQLQVALMQLVRLVKDGHEFKMSKRQGTYVTMDDLFKLIGGTVGDASDVARFFFLMRSFNTHMDFDLDLAKERSDKNPVFYVKYAYARLSSILRNAQSVIPTEAEESSLENRGRSLGVARDDKVEADLSLLVEPQETELIEQMAQLPQVLASVVMFDEYPVHYLTFYAIDLAKKFHVFYDKCKVLDEENLALSAARLELVRGAQIVLGIVMRDLIGIDAPERM